MVIFKDGTPSVSVTHQLELRYGFRADGIWSSGVQGFFSFSLTAQQVALLRCESVVADVERDTPVCPPLAPCDPAPTPSGPCAPPEAIPVLELAGKALLALTLGAVATLAATRS